MRYPVIRKFLFVLAFIALPLAATAAQYNLYKGSQYSLCRDLLRDLQTFKDEAPVCGIRFGAQFEKFAVPDWQSMDSGKNLDLLKQTYIVAMVGVGGYTPERSAREWEKSKAKTLRKIKHGKILLWQARFDLGNDGKVDTVLKLNRFGHCPANSVAKNISQPSIYALSPDGETLNRDYSRLSKYPAHIFFYQHRTFFSDWNPKSLNEDKGGKLIIYEPNTLHNPVQGNGFTFISVCKYHYLR